MAGSETTAGPEQKGTVKRWILLILLCLLVVAILGGLKYLQISELIAFGESFPERSEAVTAVTATPASWQQRYRTIGEVRATQSIELRTEVDGKITEIGFVGGSPVDQGQQLLLLDSSEERAQLQATRARLKLAELQLQRLGELHSKNLASQNDYDSAEADKNILLANIAALTATIDKKSLVAPFDAQTGLHTLQVGQFLESNTIITDLTGGMGEAWVDFQLPQGRASLVIGEKVQISSRSFNDRPLQATVISADSSLKAQSRSRGFRALLVDAPEAIRPGSVVDVEVLLGSPERGFRLPASAVRRNNFGAYVYILNEAEPGAIAAFRASRRQVTVGPTEGEDVTVTGGVEAGELIAAIGSFKLVDGLLVHVVERSAEVTSEHSKVAPADQAQESVR
jgi:membrane fusion protein (multidrug efflux system)